MSMRLLVVMLFYFLPALVEAAIIYVDRDAPCNGNGQSSTPYCSIQLAFNSVVAGDTIRIRNSASPYNERALLTRSGKSWAPIIVEPDLGHKPIIRYAGNSSTAGAIEIRNASHITIHKLTFDGSGVQTSKYAVNVRATSTDVTGITIADNTFDDWGGTNLNTNGAFAVQCAGREDGDHRVTCHILENTFTNNALAAIRVSYSWDSLIDGNTITGNRCGQYSDGRRGAIGIKLANDGDGDVIRNNIIDAFKISCGSTTIPVRADLTAAHDKYVGLYCDTGPTNGVFQDNSVSNIDPTDTVRSIGIEIESRCNGWRVFRNAVWNIGQEGMDVSGGGSTVSKSLKIWNNTFANIKKEALSMRDSNGNIEVKNNIFHNTNTRNIFVHSNLIGKPNIVINYNLYWDSGTGARVGSWGGGATDNFAQWKADCRCDANSKNVNPLFMSLSTGNLTLNTGSPAINAGTILGLLFLGSAPDMGAFERQ